MNASWKTIFFYCVTIFSTILLTWWFSQSVTTFSETMPPERQNCIILDAGHGGEDGGAVSCTGIPESRFNLEIVLRLNDLFHLLGHETKMIRTEDVSIYRSGNTLSQKKISDLKERVRITNETASAVLLSIHQNYFSDPQYSGAQVFYAKSSGSAALAEKVQSALQAGFDAKNNRKAKKIGNVYLMEHISCPGILIECGFLSNPAEEILLRTPDYQKKLCGIIASTVQSYLSNT